MELGDGGAAGLGARSAFSSPTFQPPLSLTLESLWLRDVVWTLGQNFPAPD